MKFLALMRKRRPSQARKTTIAVSSCCQPAPHVIATSGEGRTFLLDTKNDRYMGLDDVGAAVWKGLESGSTVDVIVTGLAREYDAPVQRIEMDVNEFLSGLAARGLIEVA